MDRPLHTDSALEYLHNTLRLSTDWQERLQRMATIAEKYHSLEALEQIRIIELTLVV